MKNDIIVIMASYLVFAEVGLAIGYMLKVVNKKEWLKYLIIILVAAVLAYVMSRIAGQRYYDTRPYIELHKAAIITAAHDNGFPSDHMLLAGLAASIVFIKSWRVGLCLWVLTILVGAGRVLALVHHPIDVAVSALIAILATLIAFVVYVLLDRIFLKRLSKKAADKLLIL